MTTYSRASSSSPLASWTLLFAFAVALVTLTGCSRDHEPTPAPPLGAVSSAVFGNGGFETGDAGVAPPSWTVTSGLNPMFDAGADGGVAPTALVALGVTAGGAAETFTVQSQADGGPSTDPDVPAVTFPLFGRGAARVNFSSETGNTTTGVGANKNVNEMSQTMTIGVGDVDPSDGNIHVRFAIAPILENPSHNYDQQPYYFVELDNVTPGRTGTLYTDFNGSGQPGVPWQSLASDIDGNEADYLPWGLADISPGTASLAIGDQVKLTVVAAGCSLGKHWGRLYVDGIGATVPGLFVEGSAPSSQNAGSNITYSMYYKNGAATASPSDSTFTMVTPSSTVFESISLPGCTTPTAGSTGTISCPLGAVASGASTSFTVVVKINNATAAGTTITNGNFDVSSTSASYELLGPKILTTVTSGVSYADLSITKTTSAAAFTWGETGVSYTITASNAGPNAVAGATVTDTLPADLTSATWTCTPGTNASCTSSGSGNINDALVTLPVGGSVTYTLTANVIAGSGTSSVTNIASIAAPSGTTDPSTSNNSAGATTSIGTTDQLTVNKSAAGGGTITSTPAAISCGTSCSTANANFLDGSSVRLDETAATGWLFSGWTGACASAGTASSCTLTMSGAATVGATYTSPSIVVHAGGAQKTNVNTAFGTGFSALVTDAGGSPMSGVTVTFTPPSTGASVTLSGTTAVTNASGIATVTGTANGTPGAYTLAATVAGVATPASFSLTNLGPVAAIAIVSGDSPQSATIGTAFTNPLAVVVTDSAGDLLSGVTVTFAAPPGNTSATLTATSGLTGTNGQTSISATAKSGAGTYDVTATSNGVTATFVLTNTVGAPSAIAVSSGSGQSTVIETSFASSLVALVTDSGGNPVSGASVTFTAGTSAGGASALVTGSPATTDSAGLASVGAVANAKVGTYTVSANVTGTGITASPSFTLTNTVGTPASIVVSSGSPQSATISTAFASLVALVTDVGGNPVPGASVAFTATTSAGGASAAITGSPATTNALGLATVGATANTKVGSYSVNAAVAGASSPATFSLANSAGAAATIAVSSGSGQSATIGASFAPLVAIVKDSGGNPVPGASVTFAAQPSAGGASAAVSGSPATTDASGLATVGASANTKAGAYTVTATFSGAPAPASFSLTNNAGSAASITVSSGDNQSVTVGSAFASLVALVTDSGGNPVSGASVTFTANGAAGSASATITGSPATTSSSGLATVGATANTKAGSYTVTASVSGASSPATFSLTNTAGAAASIAVSSGSGQSVTIGSGFAALVALVTDSGGNPVSGASVTFTANPSGGGASAVILGSPSTTSSSGLASVNATANTKAGSYTVTATVSGASAPATFSLTNNAGSAASITVSSGNNQSVAVGNAFAPLVALVTDSGGNPVSGASVTFTANGAAGSASAAIAGSPATTNSSGLATVGATANTKAGSYTVTASVSGASSPATFSLTNTAGAALAIAVSSGNNQSVAEGTAFASLVAIVTDSGGNAVPNASVTFTAQPSAGGASALLAGSPATTSASGLATISATANSKTGAYTVTATVSGVSAPATFNLTNTAGSAASITVSSGNNQSVAIGSAYAPLVALVTDSGGNPISGASVTFTANASAGGATATITGSPATTNGSGLATVGATAGTLVGAFTVTASVSGVSAPATFSLTNAAGAAFAIAAHSGSGQSVTVGTAFAALVALVTDSGGNPVANASVTFTAQPSAGGASAVLAGSPATTDASGLATVSASANTKAGAYTVTATVSGAAAPAVFSLTNTAGPAALISVSSGSGQTASVGTSFGSLVALVTDSGGNPVSGASVTFTPQPGATGASAVLTGSPATTDASGLASVNATANTKAGAFTVSASVSGASSPAIFSLANVAGGSGSITVSSGSGQSATVSTAYGAPLVALVTDSSGNPVSGASVAFTAQLGSSGASAAVSGSPATTDASGLARVTVTANATAGGFTVTASTAGAATQASFSLTNTAGAAAQIAVASGSGQQATVAQAFASPLVALVTDSGGNPVSGAPVAFAAPTSGASASLTSQLLISDSAGHVSVSAVSGTVSGAFNVTATLVGVTATPATFALTSLPGAAVAILAEPGTSPQTTVDGTSFPTALGVVVVDQYGNPVPGVRVTFSAPGTAPSAALSGATGVTGANGTTSVTATADGTPGVYVVTATLPNGTEVNFTLTNTATAPPTITVSSGAPASAVVGVAFGAPIVALVQDGHGSPIQGALVTFTAPIAGATAGLSAPTAITDASGLAHVTATASDVTGAYSVVASTSGAAKPAIFSLTNTPGAPASIVASPGSSPQSAQTGTAFAGSLTVTVLDSFGNPIPGVPVIFTPPSGGATAILSAGGSTNASGQASVTATANGTTGTYTVTASVSGLPSTVSFQLTNLATPPDSVAAKSGSAQSTVVGTAFTLPLRALVLDSSGNPVVGATVTFTAPASGASATFGSPGAVTDSSGVAQTTVTASHVAGSYSVTATLPAGAAPAVFALTNLPAAAATVTAAASATPQTTQIDTVYGQPLVLTVADSFGNGVPGVSVAYTAPGTGASVSLAATLPTTSSDGRTSIVAIANGTAGSFAVTATVTGLPSATFQLTNTAGAASTVLIGSGGGQSTEATTAFPEPVVLSVRDVGGNPIAGVAVTVTMPTSGASATFTPTSPVTDSTGSVTLDFTANAHVGAYSPAFSISGGSSPASVSLTNTAIPTATALTFFPTTPVAGESMTLTANVNASIGAPGGTVTFSVGGTPLGQVTIASGTAVLTTTAPAPGSYAATATYGGQDPYGTSTSNGVTIDVVSADAGAPDAGPIDGGPADAGPVDSGPVDAGAADAGNGNEDAGAPEDSGAPVADAGGPADAGAPADAGNGGGTTDAGQGGARDGGAPANTDVLQGGGCTCTSAGASSGAPTGLGVLLGTLGLAWLGRGAKRRARRTRG